MKENCSYAGIFVILFLITLILCLISIGLFMEFKNNMFFFISFVFACISAAYQLLGFIEYFMSKK